MTTKYHITDVRRAGLNESHRGGVAKEVVEVKRDLLINSIIETLHNPSVPSDSSHQRVGGVSGGVGESEQSVIATLGAEGGLRTITG